MADLMNKRYLDYAGLNLFWEKVKEYFATEGASVELAEKAKKLAIARLISIAGDAQGSVSFDGSQNVTLQSEVPELLHRIEAIRVLSGGTANPGADETDSVVSIVPGTGEGTRGTVATINLSAYAKKADFATVLDFKGVVADLAALNAITGQKKGDIYLVKDAGVDADGNPQTNVEFIWTTVDGTEKWEMLGPTVDMSGYATDADLSAERARAESAEAALSTALNNEISRATAAESTLNTAIEAEATRASAAEADLTSDLAAEASRAASAEAALGSDLVAESNRAASAEASLDSKINKEIADRETAVTAEETRAKAAEEALDARIDDLSTSVEDLDLAEVGAVGSFISAVSQTDGQLAASATAFESVIDASTAASTVAPQTAAVKAYVDTEAARAESAEASLASDISDEVSRAEAAESALYDAFKESIPDADIIAMFA